MKNRGFEVCTKYLKEGINLPIRKTKSSVGYDLEAAEDIVIPSIYSLWLKKQDVIPTLVKTGIKSYFNTDEVLILANRSSNPIKKGLVMANGIGIVESDYYNNTGNEGQIMFAFYNFFPVSINIKKGDTIGQAYFQKFLIADNDEANGIRNGGFGSTDNTN